MNPLRARWLIWLVSGLCAGCAAPRLTFSPDEPFRSETPDVAAGTRLDVPAISEATLANGLRVFSIESPEAETVRLTFVDRAAVDGDDTGYGVSAMTALALLAGTVLDDGRVSRHVELLGEPIVFWLGSGTRFDLTILPSEARSGLEMLARFVQKPALDETALGTARAEAKGRFAAESAQVYPNLRRIAARELYRGGGSPEAHFSYGTEAERARVTDDAIRHFYATRYRPGDSAVLVVGPLPAQSVLQLTRDTFEAWKPPASEQPRSTSGGPLLAERERTPGLGVRGPESLANVVAVLPCPRRNSTDTVAADLTATLLGKLWSSGLLAQLRQESGSSYSVSADCLQRRTSGLFSIVLDVEPGRFRASLDAIVDQLRRLSTEPVADSELSVARALYLGRHAAQLSTSAGLEAMLVDQFSNDLPDDYTANLEDRVNATSPVDIERFAQRYLDPAKLVIAIDGDEATLAPTLSRLGRTRWLNSDELERGD